MAPTRRRLLAALAGTAAAGATAGCLGAAPGVSDAPTATPAPCEAASPPSPRSTVGLPDPLPYPERPDALEGSTVREFLERYERAHRHNRVVAELAREGHCADHLSVSALEASVARADGGFEGTVTTAASFGGTTCPDADEAETASPLPTAHLGSETAAYRVTDRRLRREGRTLACW